jgi:hypothetical protein
MSKKQSNPLADKLWNLTEDKKVTSTPSFMDTLAPLLAMLYFSGALGGKGTEEVGVTPLTAGGSGIQRPGGGSFQPNNAWLGKNMPAMTPEMIMQMLSGSGLGASLAGLGGFGF